MKQLLLLSITTLLLVGCNSVKRNQKFLASGNYDQAIQLAVKKLQKDQNSRKADEHIYLLEEAFAKVVDRDNRRINFLTKDNSLNGLREIYSTYRGLQYKQDIIRPLLPLYSDLLGRNAEFRFQDYGDNILNSKQRLGDRLLSESNRLLDSNDKMAAREAYGLLEELRNLRPRNSEVENLMDEARFTGTTFVHVELRNRTGFIIPRPLERELLDFNTYNLDQFWTAYHEERQQDIRYDYGIRLNFRELAISPERISEKEFRRKKRVKDGWEYRRDANGNVLRDSLGNKIKVDIYKLVTARVTYTTQTKSVLVSGDVLYRDFLQQRDIDRHPLASEFIFENVFARLRGDERALTEEDLEFIEYDFVPFPSNEQMILDAGDDIKLRLSEILKNNRL